MNTPIKIGVVGAGSMARRIHVPSFMEIEGVEVTAVCDIVPERAESLAQEFGIPSTYHLQRDMINNESLDAAVVLTEPASLFHVVRQCLEAGLPTLMEKPPGITAYQTESLARAADEAGVMLQVAFNRRYIPLVRRVVEMVRERTTITQVEGRFMKEGRADFDAGSLSAFSSDTIHCVDLVRAIAAGEPVKAGTVISRYNSPVDNAWNSVFEFDNGVVGTIRANYLTGGRVHTFEIFGPGVSAFIDLGFGGMGCSARIMFGSGSQGYSLAAAGEGAVEIVELDGIELAGSDEFHKFYGYYQEDEEFVRCLREAAVPETDIHDAAKSFRLVEMIEAGVL